MNSKIKFAGLSVVAAVVVAASPFVLKIEPKQDAVAADAIAPAAGAETPATSSSAFTPTQKAELDVLIKDYLMKNPKVLIDSVNGMRDAEEKEKQTGADQALKDNSDYLLKGGLPEAGNKKADITVVEFFDYNCGYCKQGYQSVQQSLENDKNIRFVFVDFPILSESSGIAARYALAAQKQGKYFEFHSALMKFNGPKTEDSILSIAKDVGLNIDKLKEDSKDPEIDARIKKNEDLAAKLAISGTPAFIVGDQIIRGFIPYEAMKTMVTDQRKKS